MVSVQLLAVLEFVGCHQVSLTFVWAVTVVS